MLLTQRNHLGFAPNFKHRKLIVPSVTLPAECGPMQRLKRVVWAEFERAAIGSIWNLRWDPARYQIPLQYRCAGARR